tara:strand:- start:338 stop:448 length:111 start_codon:yes stop_codon:yes gene_type:complete
MYEELIFLIPLAILIIGTALVIRYPKKSSPGDEQKD